MPAIAPTLQHMIGGLIATPSISSVNPSLDQGNLAVVELLAAWLETLGFDCEILPLQSHANKANLIATLGHGPGGLVLAGHTDTVPYDEGRWQHDPFKLIDKDKRFYGLGTSDMKSFLALAIEAAKDFHEKTLQQPLIILATADEETSMSGARELMQLGRPKARYAVIGEPTNLAPVRTHKGMLMEAIRINGRSGHSSDPLLGNNALIGMYKVLGELLKWQEELKLQYHDPIFNVPYPSLNLGHIHGGDNPNRICGHCELHIDIRPLPGMDIEELQAMLQQRMVRSIQATGLSVDIHHLMPATPAMATAADGRLVQAVEQLTHHPAGAAAYSTEGPFLNQMGMETVILGPGHIAQAHQPDEYLDHATIRPMLQILQQLINQFCLAPMQ